MVDSRTQSSMLALAGSWPILAHTYLVEAKRWGPPHQFEPTVEQKRLRGTGDLPKIRTYQHPVGYGVLGGYRPEREALAAGEACKRPHKHPPPGHALTR